MKYRAIYGGPLKKHIYVDNKDKLENRNRWGQDCKVANIELHLPILQACKPDPKISLTLFHAAELPAHAQDIYREAFNHAWQEYASPEERRGDASREETAHKVAWSAVKKKYEKTGDPWTAKE